MSHTHTHTYYYGKFSGTLQILEHWNTSGQPSSAQRFAAFQSRFGGLRDWNATGTRAASAAEFGRSVRLHGTELLETDRPDAFNRDVQINDTAYRRLDPEYYAWLRQPDEHGETGRPRRAACPGVLRRAARQLNRIHEWAMARLGSAALAEAVRTLDARDYRPPAAEPADQWRSGARVGVHAGVHEEKPA